MRRIQGQTAAGLEESRALARRIGAKGESQLKKALGVSEMVALKVLQVENVYERVIKGRAYRIS